MNKPHKLLIVDDSKMMRKAIRQIFEADDQIQVAGEAANGEVALEIIPQIDPDVVTMDINMPVMDGLTTLKHIMIESPKPTVMVSTLTQEGASVTFDALKFGAVDFVSKPSKLDESKLEGQEDTVARKVTLAAQVEIEAIRYIRDVPKGESSGLSGQVACDRFIAMGAAEGGYGALLKVVPHLRSELPAAYLAVIHAASQHVDAFSRYLDNSSSIKVKRAIDGLPLEGGRGEVGLEPLAQGPPGGPAGDGGVEEGHSPGAHVVDVLADDHRSQAGDESIQIGLHFRGQSGAIDPANRGHRVVGSRHPADVVVLPAVLYDQQQGGPEERSQVLFDSRISDRCHADPSCF